ncbi:hypothetical protein CCH79_00015975, partial [Gambusia affinis]
MPPDKTEDEPYEDMNFIQSRPEAFSESIKNRGPEEAVYAQVKLVMGGLALLEQLRSTQLPADGLMDAEVKLGGGLALLEQLSSTQLPADTKPDGLMDAEVSLGASEENETHMNFIDQKQLNHDLLTGSLTGNTESHFCLCCLVSSNHRISGRTADVVSIMMMKDIKSVIAALSGNMSTLEMLLSLVFLPSEPPFVLVLSSGILALCEHYGVTLTLSTPIEALSGSCFQVPCRFEEVNKFRSKGAREGVWIKSGKDIYTTAHGINKYPIEITGDLDQFNCTTLLSDVNASLAGEYFLRLDNKKTMATACADPLQVTVREHDDLMIKTVDFHLNHF